MHAVSFLKFKLVSFLFSQINLGINDFQMLMMVVNDNLLEGEHGKLDVSNNSLSAPGGLGYSLTWSIRAFASGQGIVFNLSVLNRVII